MRRNRSGKVSNTTLNAGFKENDVVWFSIVWTTAGIIWYEKCIIRYGLDMLELLAFILVLVLVLVAPPPTTYHHHNPFPRGNETFSWPVYHRHNIARSPRRYFWRLTCYYYSTYRCESVNVSAGVVYTRMTRGITAHNPCESRPYHSYLH